MSLGGAPSGWTARSRWLSRTERCRGVCVCGGGFGLESEQVEVEPGYELACSPAVLSVQAAGVCRSPRASSQVWATSAGVL